MPPRAVNKRATGTPGRAGSMPVVSPTSGSHRLVQPHLRELQATPASRRQYSYGSGPEPAPSRAERSLRRGQQLDLGHAVGSVLQRQDEEDAQTSKNVMPPPPRPQQDLERDELAGDADLFDAEADLAQQPPDDMSDDRSFITESELFDQATIGSSPKSIPTPALRRGPGRAGQQRPSALRYSEQPLPDQTPAVLEAATEALASEAPARSALQTAPILAPMSLQPTQSVLRNPQRNTAASRAATIHQGTDQASSGLARSRTQAVSPSKFSATQEVASNNNFASNYSDADDALQREIAASDSSDAADAAPPPRTSALFAKSASSQLGRKLQKPTSGRLGSLRQTARSASGSTVVLEAEEPSWLEYIRFQALWDWLMSIMDGFNDGLACTARRLLKLTREYGAQTLGFVVTSMLVLWAAIALSQSGAPGALWDAVPTSVPSGLSPWHGVKGLANSVGNLVHSIPLPSFSRDSDISDLWSREEEEDRTAADYLRQHKKDYSALKKATDFNDVALKKLQKVVPNVVHMELKDGKPVVAEQFWHAVRDLLRADGSFLNMDKEHGEFAVSSDKQWSAIATRLASDPTWTGKLNAGLEDVHSRVEDQVSVSWEAWVRDNEDKIASQLGSAIEQVNAAASGDKLDGVVKTLLEKHVQTDSTIVTREEFIRHLNNEFSGHRDQMRREMEELLPRFKGMLDEAVAVAKSQTPPAGMSRADVTNLVNDMIRKSLASISIEALARGKIHSHWSTDLSNQVNYFALGAGATIDGKRTSPIFDPHKKGFIKEKAYEKGLRGSRPLPPAAALTPWEEEGDCFCGARQQSDRGNPHDVSLSVQLGHQVIPQYIVLDHILPGATTDPGAMPKNIEIYAKYEDPELRGLALDFSAVFFPDGEKAWDYTPQNFGEEFVKIGQFVYEGAQANSGVQIHRLSDELVQMRAWTDQVVVRATDNYGAERHTCFYRVRMYGEKM
ncbi:uncharacterized protein J7T54_007877 [Emericellopsis cladophorae]|uniref:SUN domain-containing protein n=1 Tax=Emericellopsis cladophorae TaxID=2686198 RepID=A0A9P9Y8L1_9HYPO|nr:uncharacterized protein J7T54_007877 [Emericellopsis cladophorae]KAI6784784.1 hypothetical protein J7T54_007877 [Emericellopsis cladophorae]